ncbi:MAG: LD-carboxypeptidase [Calditrichaeota bacterium]|nr:LD-carboxypeptidase [Calditrichota bacterium]
MPQKEILKPPALRFGATIGVVSPASRPLNDEKFDRGIEYLKQRGYQVVEGAHARDRYGYLAGKDADRAADLNQMFADPAIEAIICSRGGYGTPRMIDRLNFDIIRQNPKIFVGYSDITSLQLAIWKETQLITFSGPMVAVEMGAGIDDFTEQRFWRMITDAAPSGLLHPPEGHELKLFSSGRATGPLIGGCLSLINTVLGTPYCPDFEGAIFYIEDIEEEPYHLDRYLAQMKMAGIFEQIAGLVLGQFVDCEPGEPEKPYLTVEQIFENYFSELKIPIVGNFPYGHVPVKHTMPLGVEAEINTDAGGLILLESPVTQQVA